MCYFKTQDFSSQPCTLPSFPDCRRNGLGTGLQLLGSLHGYQYIGYSQGIVSGSDDTICTHEAQLLAGYIRISGIK